MSLSTGLFGAAGLTALIAGVLLGGAPALVAFLYFRRVKARWRVRHAELASANRRNLAIVDASGEGVLELDNSGCVRYANPAAVKMLGYEPQELFGADYRVLFNMQEDGRTDAVRKVRYTTNILGGVGAVLRRKNGQMRPVEYKIVPVHENGVSLGTILVFRDMNERVRLDNLLKEMQVTARVGGWEYEIQTKKTYWTDALYAIFEVSGGQPIELDTFTRFFSSEDGARLQASTQRAIEADRKSVV